MRLVCHTYSLEAFTEEETIQILASSGFDAIDWSFFRMKNDTDAWNQENWRERAEKMKTLAAQCGIGFSQAHAPYPTSKGEEPFDTVQMERIRRSMEAAAIMGVHYIIVHPRQHLRYTKSRQQLFDENVAMYKALIPHCQQLGIHVCAENMWQYDSSRSVIVDSVCSQPEEFCAMIDAIDSPWIGACLDIGHTGLVGQDPSDFIRALGSQRLKALHVHDVDLLHDNHTLPFLQKINWEAVTKALADIDYQGDFTFEAENFVRGFPKELQEDACKLMERTGRYLISRIKANRC